MEGDNATNVTTFILLGFSDLPVLLQATIFMFLLSAYVFTLLGNGLIIFVVSMDSQLHTPMYFFLRNLSFMELCFTSVTVPKVLVDFLSRERSISFMGCAVQMYFFFTIGVSECVFLLVMAFDRYVAICYPLRYVTIMNQRLCYQLTSGSWLVGSLVSLGQTIFIFILPFCGSNHIAHFFCDIPPLLYLACVNTFINELSVFIACILGAVVPFVFIICSYIKIMSSILLISSVEGRHKAFSTCASHLVSVILFYGTAMFVHLRLGMQPSAGRDRLVALFYCIVIPAVNPLIYSLRNSDMKASLKKLTISTNMKIQQSKNVYL
ncbi:olfactory receptor 10AG1-like [Bombina bombina]|uniref:olfactory receptor 10AG1-like n=1 Tax=Bombina bombina TaxID=8345 RepID=UPI00235B2E44|nr:olfactory receptor 10AG1-like [Bombina bombina]